MWFKLRITAIAAYAVQSISADSIYDIVNTTGNFSSLAGAIDAANLTEPLSGDGNFTLFAPINSAFEELPPDLLAKLTNETWKPQLQDILLYHLLDSEVLSADLIDGMTVTTCNGENITINLDPARINENATILVDEQLVNISASNAS
mmetsp:Transcript_32524/g.68379  ORF Transcript_32524/g.68379 Transcript_32524/m.68379 type:complete len:148 (+) Transcript_32524:64-507(+)